MKLFILSYLLSVAVLSGCGGPLGNWKLQRNVVAEVNTGSSSKYETVVRNGIEFQIERSGAHPTITWAVGPNRLAAIMGNVADQIDYETIDTLSGNRYKFLKECDGEAMVFHPSVSTKIYPVTYRVLEYTDQATLYILRDEDMGGRKFRDFIVVQTWLRPTGNYSHSIVQRTNKREEIKFCADAGK